MDVQENGHAPFAVDADLSANSRTKSVPAAEPLPRGAFFPASSRPAGAGQAVTRDARHRVMVMDNGIYRLAALREKHLPVEEIAVYNHMAFYLRWCIEHDLIGNAFREEYRRLIRQILTEPARTDLRLLIRDELAGQLYTVLFNQKGRAFARYYYGRHESPSYPEDVETYAVRTMGPQKCRAEGLQGLAYLFLPFSETCYQAVAQIISRRFSRWQRQKFDLNTLVPSELHQAVMSYLCCRCTYFPAMQEEDPIRAAWGYARRDSAAAGFFPILIQAEEPLWDSLVGRADPDNAWAGDYRFDPDRVAAFREQLLGDPLPDGKALLAAQIRRRRAQAAAEGREWEAEVLGQMRGGRPIDPLAGCRDLATGMTVPLILARIPAANPWEVFAYLPIGGWYTCPDVTEWMAVAQYWFARYGAVPVAISYNSLTFALPAPVSADQAMTAAVEQYALCPDLDQGDSGSIGMLANTLRQSRIWHLFWD